MARYLGAQGVWVDHVSTLDPHPVSGFGDPSMKNYSNILFADNYWQDMGDNFIVPNGQAIGGAYNRHMTNLSGGYSSSHSDAHLWYHGTIDLRTPILVDTASITANERQAWWTPFEQAGTNTGFLYSLIGGGDRLSTAEPSGTGNGRINDGFNKVWDIGAGIAPNRNTLPLNNGAWPNLLRLTVSGTNRFVAGDPIPLTFYYQYGSNTSVSATVRFFLDPDTNPFNSNALSIDQINVAGTGTNSVGFLSRTMPPNASMVAPGSYFVYATIGDGARGRYLYAPQKIVLLPGTQPPLLLAEGVQGGIFHCTVAGLSGQTIVIQGSTNLSQWISLQTNKLVGTTWDFQDSESTGFPRRFYRAVLQ
jgi:hypothetical protein